MAAAKAWAATGIPTNPAGWLVTTARRKAVDRLRRAAAAERRHRAWGELAIAWDAGDVPGPVADDRLQLIFTCCHPSLSLDAQVALTLRSLGGLTTEEVAKAFLVAESTLAQRIVRAKRKIRAAAIPYRVPSLDEFPERLGAVLAVVYLIFNAGYLASSGTDLVRVDLCDEGVRLAGLLVDLLPDEPEPLGLAALLHFQDSRRTARSDDHGRPLTLEEQDRRRWDTAQVAAGRDLLGRAQRLGRTGPYQLKAAIAAVHAGTSHAELTDWTTIVRLYDRLLHWEPTPIVRLNRAVAVAMADGPTTGLALLDDPALAGGAGRLPPLPLHPGRPPAPGRSSGRGGRRLSGGATPDQQCRRAPLPRPAPAGAWGDRRDRRRGRRAGLGYARVPRMATPSPVRLPSASLRPVMASTRLGERPGDLGTVTVAPVGILGPQPEPGDPSLGPDEKVRLLVGVGHGDEGLLGRLVDDPEGPADVFAMDHDLAQHGHDGGRWMVRRGRPRPQPGDDHLGSEGSEAPGRPIGEDVEFEPGGDQFLVEVGRGLLGRGQDVAGRLLDRPARAQRGRRPGLGRETGRGCRPCPPSPNGCASRSRLSSWTAPLSSPGPIGPSLPGRRCHRDDEARRPGSTSNGKKIVRPGHWHEHTPARRTDSGGH